MNVQEIIYAISNKVDIDPTTMEKVVGTILSVLQHETEGTSAERFFDKLPGSLELAEQYDVMAPDPNSGGGLLSSLQGALGGALGEKAGALINGIAQLKATGLDMEQIQQAGSALVEEARSAVGPKAIDDLLAQVPSLKGQLGLKG